MTLQPGRWGVQVADEHGGHSRQLPDLAYQPASDSSLPVAVMVVNGRSNPRCERAALDGWRGSILAGQYAQVRWVTGPADARHLTRLATELGLTAPQFIAGEHVMPEDPLVIPSIVESPDTPPVAVTESSVGFETKRCPPLIYHGFHRRTVSHRVEASRSPLQRPIGQPNSRS